MILLKLLCVSCLFYKALSTPPKRCRNGFIKSNDFGCYAVVKANLDSFSSAQKACYESGGSTTLPRVTSLSLNSFLVNVGNSLDTIWLDAYYSGSQLLWGDSTTVATGIWDTNEPTDLSTNPCVELNVASAKWNDIVCDASGLSRGLTTGTVCFSSYMPDIVAAQCVTDACKRQLEIEEEQAREYQKLLDVQKNKMAQIERDLRLQYSGDDIFSSDGYTSTASGKEITKVKRRPSKERISIAERNSRSKGAFNAQVKRNSLSRGRERISVEVDLNVA